MKERPSEEEIEKILPRKGVLTFKKPRGLIYYEIRWLKDKVMTNMLTETTLDTKGKKKGAPDWICYQDLPAYIKNMEHRGYTYTLETE